MRLTPLSLVILLTMFSPARCRAQAIVINFDNLDQAGSGSVSLGASYSTQGFDITDVGHPPNNSDLDYWQTGNSNFVGKTALFSNNSSVTLQPTTPGALFSAVSIQLAPAVSQFMSPQATFSGTTQTNQVVTQTFILQPQFALQTFTFSADFVNLKSLSFEEFFTAPTDVQFTNVSVQLVPEPGTTSLLFSAGIIGLTLARRRKLQRV